LKALSYDVVSAQDQERVVPVSPVSISSVAGALRR
jgi:hypothetical protein